MISRRITALAAALLLPSQSAAAVQQSCVTPVEGQAMISSFLPDLILGLSDSCRASLPADAFLVRSGAKLADRYTAEADRAWTQARPVMGRMIGKDIDLFAKLDDQTARKVFAAGIAAKMKDAVKGKDCATLSGAFEALEPLPPANMSMLIGVIFEALGRDKKQKSTGFDICPPSTVPATQ